MMDNNDELKSLWSTAATVPAPDITRLLDSAASIRRKALNKMIWGNLLLIATSVFIAWIWIRYQPQMLTTKIGIVMVIASMVIYIIASTSSLQFLFRSEPDMDAASYLAQLLRLKQKQEYLQKTIMTAYYILLSAGMALYMIEYATMLGRRYELIAYAVTFGWIALAWFYIRPRIARKQLRPLNEAIEQLEEVNRQLRD
ncbi:MAG: hypothetical protein JST83_10680 [Bacteroidetes bacterium]|nr:hypothetical protein [Bacteroidota bacterium]